MTTYRIVVFAGDHCGPEVHLFIYLEITTCDADFQLRKGYYRGHQGTTRYTSADTSMVDMMKTRY